MPRAKPPKKKDLTVLKGELQLLTPKEREEVRRYMDALDAYTPTAKENDPRWQVVQQVVREESGIQWPPLYLLPPTIQPQLRDKLTCVEELSKRLNLTKAGLHRFWSIYLHRLASGGAPIAPATLANWSLFPHPFLRQNLPYPPEIQAQVLNNGLR